MSYQLPTQKKSPIALYILFGVLGICTLSAGSCVVCFSNSVKETTKKIADEKKALEDARARSGQIVVLSVVSEPPKDRALFTTVAWRNDSAETVEAVRFRVLELNERGEWIEGRTILITPEQPVAASATSTISLPIDYSMYPPPTQMNLKAEYAFLKAADDKLRPLSED